MQRGEKLRAAFVETKKHGKWWQGSHDRRGAGHENVIQLKTPKKVMDKLLFPCVIVSVTVREEQTDLYEYLYKLFFHCID